MKKFFILLFALILFTACTGDEEIYAPTDEFPATHATTELTVWGMMCNACVNKITNALSGVDGIISVSVDLNAELVTVEHDFDVDAETIERTITGEGFNIP